MIDSVSKGVLVHRVRKKREKQLQYDSDPNTFFEDAEKLAMRLFLVSGALVKAEMKKAKACKSGEGFSDRLENEVKARIQKQLIHQLMKGLESKIPGLLAVVAEMKDGEFSPIKLSPKEAKVRKAILTEQDIKRFGSRRCEVCCKMILAFEPVVYAVQDAKNRIWHAACAVTEEPAKTTLRKYVVLEKHIERHGIQDCRVCSEPMMLGTEVSWKVGSTPIHSACQESEDSAGPEASDDESCDWLPT